MEGRPGVLEAVEEAARTFESGGMVVFEAPTGYGKTTSTPILYSRLREKHGFARIVHALPLRAIVEQATLFFREKLPGARVGFQAGGLTLSGKTPFYGADVVVSTLDSLAMTVARWSLGEPDRLGHYEVPRAHLFSSMIVLDEAHLPFQPNPFAPENVEERASRAATVMAGLAYTFSHFRVPVLVETATLPASVRAFIAERYRGPGRVECIVVDEPGASEASGCRVVEDPDYFETVRSVEWKYGSLDNLDDAIEKAAEAAETGERVFLSSTTVKAAVKAYEMLAERLGGKVVLVHGRLSAADRERAVERLRDAQVLVGTPAVEAGVDYDADLLLTDVPGAGQGWIAWESLLQRMGRVARRPMEGRRAEIIFYGEGAGDAEARMKGVNPRIPSTYRHLIDERRPPRIDAGLLDAFLQAAVHFTPTEALEELRERLCNPMREALLTQIVIPEYEVDPSRGEDLEHVLSRMEAGMTVTTSLHEGVASKAEGGRGWLLERDGKIIVLARGWKSVRGHPGEVEYRLEEVSLYDLAAAAGRCGIIRRNVYLEALIAKPEAYREGVGLV